VSIKPSKPKKLNSIDNTNNNSNNSNSPNSTYIDPNNGGVHYDDDYFGDTANMNQRNPYDVGHYVRLVR
jgi:hypothetical protein